MSCFLKGVLAEPTKDMSRSRGAGELDDDTTASTRKRAPAAAEGAGSTVLTSRVVIYDEAELNSLSRLKHIDQVGA